MGIKPEKFGPYFWGALHLACLGDADPQAVRTFVDTFALVIPCASCRVHFSEVLKANPVPQTDDPIELFNWSVDVHNIVNARIGKETIGYEEALKVWISMNPPEPAHFDFKIMIIILLAIALIFMLLRNKK